VVNLLMGLTPFGVIPFYLVSQIGMLLITAVYVNAGSELAQITSLSGLVSPSVILSLVLVGVSPLAAKLLINAIKRARK
ncbi:MAG: pyridine nucleotide-disulfide oxidoreductase, partial [Gammaproteobacteria bacterium]|nr:pyridine nucleotide-disulfide oxidoreductase [Gammaproteobacteria bacterium]